jgi:hypothetical protein
MIVRIDVAIDFEALLQYHQLSRYCFGSSLRHITMDVMIMMLMTTLMALALVAIHIIMAIVAVHVMRLTIVILLVTYNQSSHSHS